MQTKVCLGFEYMFKKRILDFVSITMNMVNMNNVSKKFTTIEMLTVIHT